MPAYSKTSLCNLGLSAVGINSRIGNVDTEKSNEAIQCRLWYDHVRVLILEAKLWPGMADKEFELQALTNPSTQWAKLYKYPSNCLFASHIINPASRTPGRGGKIPFKPTRLSGAYGKGLYCDQDNAILVGNEDVTDPTLFTSTFAQAMIMGIGAHVSPSLRVDTEVMKASQAGFREWMMEASQQVNREAQEDEESDSEFETVRA